MKKEKDTLFIYGRHAALEALKNKKKKYMKSLSLKNY